MRGLAASPRNTHSATSSEFHPKIIDLNEFQSFVAARQGLVVDARSSGFYDQGHVPGAISLPRDSFASAYAKLRSTLAAHRARTIAIYCSEADCPDSDMVADALAKLGYEHLMVYREGWEEWTQAGLPGSKSSAQ